MKDNLGLYYNSKGNFESLNINLLVDCYLRHHPTVCWNSKRYYKYKEGVWRETTLLSITSELRQLVHQVVPNVWNSRFSREVADTLPLACDSATELKEASGFLNLSNGLLDLEAFQLESHCKEVFSTVQLPFAYDPDARCPHFKAFLKEVFLGDKELIRLVQEMTGYALSPKIEAQKLFFLYSGGASGKSVYCHLLSLLAGGAKHVSSVALGDLGKKFQRSQLFDKVVNISTENEVRSFNTQALKAIVCGDPIQIEQKGEDPFTAVMAAKLIFSLNTLPSPKDTTYAFYRRLVLVPFLARFVDDPNPTKPEELQRDPLIMERLQPELPGILVWALKGLKRLAHNGYQFSDSSKARALLADYMRDLNPVLDFLKETVREAVSSQISIGDFYDAYRRWSTKNGLSKPLEKRKFLKEARYQMEQLQLHFANVKSNSIRYIKGIAFRRTFMEGGR